MTPDPLRRPPPLIYRYMGSHVVDFLKDPHLRFSNPSEFNDPFEFRPEVRLRGARAEIRDQLRMNDLPPEIPVAEAEDQFARKIHEMGLKDYHAICFTEDPLNLGMWGLYAAKHKGCVLGFDSEIFEPFRQLGLDHMAGPVVYSDKRPVIELPTTNPQEAERQIIFSKGPEWSSEREWRIAISRRGTGTATATRPLNFDKRLLRLVIIGARADKAQAKEIRDALSANEQLKHVELLKAKVASRGYALSLHRRDRTEFDLSHFLTDYERVRELRRQRGQTFTAEVMRRRQAAASKPPKGQA